MMHRVRRLWGWASRIGWVLLAVACLIGALFVLVKAGIADATAGRLVRAGAGSDAEALSAAKDSFDRWTGWANIAALPVGAIGTVLVLVERAVRRHGALGDDDKLIEDLTASVRRTLSTELVYRQARNPAPILVRWSSTGRPAASRDAVLGDGTRGDGPPMTLGDDAGRIVVRFRQLPHRQMVILGEAGAGKSVLAMLLTLGLLEDPEAGQRVPVLLPINSWKPATERLEQFLARGLAEAYGDVLGAYGEVDEVATRLVESRRLMPVLDGFDELPARGRVEAFAELDEFALHGNHLVVTSRGADYEAAVRGGGVLLTRAAVVEIEPVALEAAISYLSYPEMRRPLWTPVFERMRQSPEGPLAQTLDSPLMIGLARTAYLRAPSEPTELLALKDQDAVARRLMDAFVTATYDGRRPGTRRSDEPDSARRWLSCLAFHLYEHGTRDLHWWEIEPDLLARRPRLARIATTAMGMLILAAIAGGLGALIDGESTAGLAALFALLVGAGTASGLLRLVSLEDGVKSSGWWGKWHASRASGSVTAAVCGLLSGLLIREPVAAVICAALSGLLILTSRWVAPLGLDESPTDEQVSGSRMSWGVVGATAIFYALLGAGFVGVTVGPTAGPSRAGLLAAAALGALVFGATAALSAGAWRRLIFRLTHARLVVAGRLPVRLSSFLDDAHRSRAVLRRAGGGSYQFRHALLQDHLALVQAADHAAIRSRAGDEAATERLPYLLTRLGRLDEVSTALRRQMDAGDPYVAGRLADSLVEQGRIDEALAVLRSAAADKRKSARYDRARLARVLVQHGRMEELRARADQGDRQSLDALVENLAATGQMDEAITRLTALAAAGSRSSTARLVGYLVQDQRVAELRSLAERGDVHAVSAYLELLIGQHQTVDALAFVRDLTEHRRYAENRLDDLLMEHGHEHLALERARAAYEAGSDGAALRLADLLAQQGEADEAIAVLRSASGEDAMGRLAGLLVETGRIDDALAVMRDHPAAASIYVVDDLVDRLLDQARDAEALDMLQARVVANRRHAIDQLLGFLVKKGLLDEAVQALRDHPGALSGGARQVLSALVAAGRLDEAISLARRTSATYGHDDDLVELLVRAGRLDEVTAMAKAGDAAAERWQLDQLAELGQLDKAATMLRAKIAHGDQGAAWTLASFLARQGRNDEATALMQRYADAGDADAQGWLAALASGHFGEPDRLSPSAPQPGLRSVGAGGDQADPGGG
jgi:hypothetical protein